MGDAHMGLQARLMSQALRKLTAATARNNTCVIFINQLRQKIGVVYGNPETTTGGNALKFYASVRLDIRKTGQVKNGDVVMGNKARVKVVKNKVAPPFREAEFEILYGMGVNWSGELVDLASDGGLLEKSGAHYSWKGERVAPGTRQGRRVPGRASRDRRRDPPEPGRGAQGPEPGPGRTGHARVRNGGARRRHQRGQRRRRGLTRM